MAARDVEDGEGKTEQVELAYGRRFAYDRNAPVVKPGSPPPDGFVEVGWDQNTDLPAYDINGELVPFTPMARVFPQAAGDYTVEQFTDTVIKRLWLNAGEETRKRLLPGVLGIVPPLHEFRATGSLDTTYDFDPHVQDDLSKVRRPGFFAGGGRNEAIARVDPATTIVEIAVPQGPYERLQKGFDGPVYLRGWHIAGAGVPDPDGSRKRALVVLTSGRSIETTASENPDDPAAKRDLKTGEWVQCLYPGGDGTECFGARGWRNGFLLPFVEAGFDVLTLDKRGHGISGSTSDGNTNEQARDTLRALIALENGSGLRTLDASGTLRDGAEAAGRLLSGYKRLADVPVFFGGASQGCIVTQWIMAKLLGHSTDFDRPEEDSFPCPALDLKGGLLLASFGSGLAYRAPDEALLEAARRLELNLQFFPSSEPLASVPDWPSLFIGRGLWDFAESLEGSFDTFRRATGPKALVAVRGPHGESEWGDANRVHLVGQMIAFCRAVLHDQPVPIPEPESLRDIVASAPKYWAPFKQR